jgi:hypothetical protein
VQKPLILNGNLGRGQETHTKARRVGHLPAERASVERWGAEPCTTVLPCIQVQNRNAASEAVWSVTHPWVPVNAKVCSIGEGNVGFSYILNASLPKNVKRNKQG